MEEVKQSMTGAIVERLSCCLVQLNSSVIVIEVNLSSSESLPLIFSVGTKTEAKGKKKHKEAMILQVKHILFL